MSSETPPFLPSKYSGLQLPRISLKLVSMFVHTTEEVRATVNVEHYALALLLLFRSPVVVRSHLDPFCLQLAIVPSPLPPKLASDVIDTLMSELSYEEIGGFCDLNVWDFHVFRFDPSRARNPLGCESLYFFNGMMGSVGEELANEAQSFVVGNVRCGFLLPRLAIEVLNCISN